ncbi:MAG: preprotein translocase subunit SecG [bacterium]|nr:preprotein translocase subunit SecG [bacterium]
MQILSIVQLIIAIAIIILILLQERSSGLSGVLGGGESGGFYQTRRGLEKLIFRGTIVLVILFLILSVVNLIV